MRDLIRYPLQKGGTILVEVEIPESEKAVDYAARSEPLLQDATQTFEDSIDEVRQIATAFIDKLRDSGKGLGPNAVEVEFGLKLGGKAGIIIASGSIEANFKVKLNWEFSTDGSSRI
jgi:uncharacterized protein with ATP-grasp and redox domains